ncbi:hypothetical protein M8C21_033045 [Ambrosia artemisiifolia]|uniref:Uncharacterized protein n=1 Tax=Ambrosia artemisiifolia TaxID=4212 RepID=A0AAD5CFW3_AMBAR|nr:hypothetical protein M8C21_033045 [Ambrosia artemisiifolia]
MINSEININDVGTNVAGTAAFHKQTVFPVKKVALREVQNSNNNLTRDTYSASLLPADGQLFVDASKTCGTKRATPDYSAPSNLTNHGAQERFNFLRNKHEGYQGKNVGYPQSASLPQIKQEVSQINGKNMHYGSFVAPNQMASKTSVSRLNEFNDERRTDRLVNLQNFIDQCDKSDYRDNIQSLLHLSPLELSRHAVELEKRAIHLTIEEGKEMQRMQALNILGKPSITRSSMPITQHIQHKN